MLPDISVWDSFDPIAQEHPERPCVITPSTTRSYGDIRIRARRLARFLADKGLGFHTERSRLADHESGQDHLAIYLGNGPEYVETFLGAMRARLVPVNVNYRYTPSELARLLRDTQAAGIVYDAELAPVLIEALRETTPLRVLIQVGGDRPLLPGAQLFEELASNYADDVEAIETSPDDLCIVCTGGTTGFPKAVLWRQADLVATMIGDRHIATGAELSSLDDLIEGARVRAVRMLVAPPMMHLNGFGLAMLLLTMGGTVVFASPPRGLSAQSILEMIEKERVEMLLVVGDAFGRPLLNALGEQSWDLSSLRIVMNGGASMSPGVKSGLQERLGTGCRITDGIGSSESGVLARSAGKGAFRAGVFRPASTTAVLADSLDRVLPSSDHSPGWLASFGRIPLGYFGDQEKTAETFKRVGDRRCVIPGDRARWIDDGFIETLGREAATINTGGEKVFSEEVEREILAHPDVEDVLVVGRPSERWGQEVVALVVPRPGRPFDRNAVMAACGERLARYKHPKDLIVVDQIARTAVGKPDYKWARAVAAQSSTQNPSVQS
jgi:fatty-acyl-CoA synthase